MGPLRCYFRLHPWQRRTLTLTLAAILGMAIAWRVWPMIQEARLMQALRATDLTAREAAMARAEAMARQRPGFLQRVLDRLSAADDEEFCTLADVLSRMGVFDGEHVDPPQMDRYRTINLATSSDVRFRVILLQGLIKGGRDNSHVRRGLAVAAGDESTEVRAYSAVLAARLGDDAALVALLGDADADVRAAAARCAVLGDRRDCRDAVAARIAQAAGDEETASAALALWKWSDGQPVLKLLAEADQAGKKPLRDLLLGVVSLPPAGGSPRPEVASGVLDVLARGRRQGPFAPAMALIAAGRLNIAPAEPFIVETLDAALKKRALTAEELESLSAALQAAGRMRLDQSGRVARVLNELWHPGTPLVSVLAAGALGEMLGRPAAAAGAASAAAEAATIATTSAPVIGRGAALAILAQAADAPDAPVPSAAAAAACFQIDPTGADAAVEQACQSEALLAGDYLAWQLAALARRPGPDGDARRVNAERLARSLLTGSGMNVGQRSAGAVLLALLTRGTDRAAQAGDAIEGRVRTHPNANPLLVGSYRCALVTLGRESCIPEVMLLATSEKFSRHRAETALILAGNPAGLDYIFATPDSDAGWIDSLLARQMLWRVVESAAPSLPPFDVDAPPHVRAWQCRLLRDDYLIHRQAILRSPPR